MTDRVVFDHRLFARAASIKSAQSLVDIYRAEGAKVAPIDSHVSKKVQEETEAALISGALDGVVCVDMFGEGYDFPKLKIAALHAPHKSLVPTLQFIGRFARTTDSATGDATLVAPLSRIRDVTAKLFQEGIDIAQLIDGAAQGEFTKVAENQQILDILKTRRQAESDYDSVSPLSLELYAHTRIFECARRPEFDRFGATIGKKLKLAKQWMSDDGLIGLLLTVDHEPPSWATWIPSRSATRLREADLNVLSKLSNQGLEWRLEPEAFSGGEVGREDDLLDVLVGCPVDIQVARQPST